MQSPHFNSSVEWVRHASTRQSWRLRIKNCSLDITRQQAIACIKKHAPRGMLMIGDSVTRYQYLSLAYFLVTGRWRSPRPSNANEKEFGSWQNFYNLTNARLDGAELCDCYRQEYTLANITESRFFRKDGIRLTYLQMFRPPVIRAHPIDYIKNCSPFCKPNDTYHDFDVERSPDRLLNWTRSYSLSFINAGHWFPDSKTVVAFSDKLAGITSDSVHWKTTTFPGERIVGLETKFRGGVFDAHALTQMTREMQRSLMWDALHFTDEVYRGLNEALLNYLCNI
jgi:hypothetical protein